MKPCLTSKKFASAAERGTPEIGFSITNQRGEHYYCQATGVSLRVRRGVVQLIEGQRGCFVWFDRGRVELRDGRRHVLYRLHTGSASSDGDDLTIVAEVVGAIDGVVKAARARSRAARKPAPTDSKNGQPPAKDSRVQSA